MPWPVSTSSLSHIPLMPSTPTSLPSFLLWWHVWETPFTRSPLRLCWSRNSSSRWESDIIELASVWYCRSKLIWLFPSLQVIRPLDNQSEGSDSFDPSPYINDLFTCTIRRLKAADIDQEVKERAISCMGQIICNLGNRNLAFTLLWCQHWCSFLLTFYSCICRWPFACWASWDTVDLLRTSQERDHQTDNGER